MEAPRTVEYAEVVIDTPVKELDRPFHYSVPAELQNKLWIGSLVLVPFTNRKALGYVVGFPEKPEVKKLKSISEVLDEPPVFDFDGQRLARWIASHYMSSVSQAFRLLLPPGRGRSVKQMLSLAVSARQAREAVAHRSAIERELVDVLATAGNSLAASRIRKHLGLRSISSEVNSLLGEGVLSSKFVLFGPAARPRSRLVVRVTEDVEDDSAVLALPDRQRQLLQHLLATGGVEFQSDLLKDVGASASSLKSLERKGLVDIDSEEVLRKPRLTGGAGSAEKPVPNPDQQKAIDRICGYIDSGLHQVFLLEGVTGSGKTEVYLRCIERVLDKGKGAIVLVPEISLTPQTLERFSSRFPGRVAVLHSKLSAGERFDQWRGIREGRYRVVIGARSALFAPVDNLGLIALDEEHETSYKSDKAPRYHARDVAQRRSGMSGAVLILGSATPSFESLESVRAGTYSHLTLPRRIDNRPLPDIEIVDMRTTGGAGMVPLLSTPLLDALSRTVEAGDQAILFLNRRGFANYLQCRACGYIPDCDECDVSLCYHSRGDMLLCHHCGKRTRVPPKCPRCGTGDLKQFGAGTQRVERELERQLPGVPALRMDTDTTSAKDAHWRILGSFRRAEAQVLIGTQMIAKGLDIPGVTLVGVINADTALALPDFHASERTYQLLTQVSGRAGRGLRPGRVIVQTFNPEHPAIMAVRGPADSFIDSELETRLSAIYPPFVEIVNVLVTSSQAPVASRSARRMKQLLQSDLDGSGAILLGPAPAPLSRLRGNYRWHLVIKSADLDKISGRIRLSVSRFYDYARAFPAGSDVRISLDVNPVSLL